MAKETQKDLAARVLAAIKRNLPENFKEENVINTYAQLKEIGCGKMVEWTTWATNNEGEKFLLHADRKIVEQNLETGVFHVGKIKEADLKSGLVFAHSIK